MKEKEPSRNIPRSVMEGHPDLVKGVGMISIEIANLDIFLGDMLGAILHVDPIVGRTVYLTPKSAFGRLEILENVIEHSMTEGKDLRKHASALVVRAKNIVRKRHEMMHEAWGLSQADPNTVVRRPLPFKDKVSSKPVTLEELTRLIDDIRRLAEEIIEFRTQTYSVWPAYTYPDWAKEPEVPST